MGLLPEDFAWAKEFGYALKLLAVARRSGPERRGERPHRGPGPPGLHPAATRMLAGVRGAMNAVLLRSEALGPTLLFGQGAGAMPTGSAVVADIIDLSRNLLSGSPGRVPLPPAQLAGAAPLPRRDPDRATTCASR